MHMHVLIMQRSRSTEKEALRSPNAFFFQAENVYKSEGGTFDLKNSYHRKSRTVSKQNVGLFHNHSEKSSVPQDQKTLRENSHGANKTQKMGLWAFLPSSLLHKIKIIKEKTLWRHQETLEKVSQSQKTVQPSELSVQ